MRRADYPYCLYLSRSVACGQIRVFVRVPGSLCPDLALTSVEQGFVPRLRYVFNRVEYVNNDPELPVQR